MYSVPKIENAPLSDLPPYTGGYIYCWVRHVDPNTQAESHKVISDEEATFLRNLYYKYKRGLRIKSGPLEDKIKSLENKGLVEKRSRRFYLSIIATNAEYTLVPRLVFTEDQD